MITPVRIAGDKPPLFFIHGHYGLMPLGSTLGTCLGPDQPIYAINADGMDGKTGFTDEDLAQADLRGIVDVYVDQILAAHRGGPLRVAGMCAGAVAALDVVRGLLARGVETGPVILADPPALPHSFLRSSALYQSPTASFLSSLRDHVRDNLRTYTRYPKGDVPFDIDDPRQLEVATSAAMRLAFAFARHRAEPLAHPVVGIITKERAVAFLHPDLVWSKLAAQKLTTQILPYGHDDLFGPKRHTFARALNYALEIATTPEVAPPEVTPPEMMPPEGMQDAGASSFAAAPAAERRLDLN